MGPTSSGLSRRELLGAGASVTGLGLAAALGGFACAESRPIRASSSTSGAGAVDAELLDAALERIAARFPDVNVHRSNHAPMVSEALSVLGRGDAIAPWLDAHLEEFERGPEARVPIERERWHDALGREERYADWQALFLSELAADDWRLVLRRWVPRLAPGLAGAATHGLIRTAHGARGLAAQDNDIRRRELATGLAYWSISYEELPWDGTLAPAPSVAAALAQITPRQPALAPPQGNIVMGLRALKATPSFLPIAGRIDTKDPARTLSEMSAAFARLYLANPEHRIPFTHTVTAPSALRLLAPYLDEETVRAGVRYAWQAAAGIHVVYGDPRKELPAARPPRERAALIARAIEKGGAHAIKLTEACLREEALAHEPLLLDAARDAGESQNS